MGAGTLRSRFTGVCFLTCICIDSYMSKTCNVCCLPHKFFTTECAYLTAFLLSGRQQFLLGALRFDLFSWHLCLGWKKVNSFPHSFIQCCCLGICNLLYPAKHPQHFFALFEFYSWLNKLLSRPRPREKICSFWLVLLWAASFSAPSLLPLRKITCNGFSMFEPKYACFSVVHTVLMLECH